MRSTAATTSNPTVDTMPASGEDPRVLSVFSFGLLFVPECSMEFPPGRALDPGFQAFAANLSSKAVLPQRGYMSLDSTWTHDIDTSPGFRSQDGHFVHIRETLKACQKYSLGGTVKLRSSSSLPPDGHYAPVPEALKIIHRLKHAGRNCFHRQTSMRTQTDLADICADFRIRGDIFLRSWKC
jgi:hypothetical protein